MPGPGRNKRPPGLRVPCALLACAALAAAASFPRALPLSAQPASEGPAGTAWLGGGCGPLCEGFSGMGDGRDPPAEEPRPFRSAYPAIRPPAALQAPAGQASPRGTPLVRAKGAQPSGPKSKAARAREALSYQEHVPASPAAGPPPSLRSADFTSAGARATAPPPSITAGGPPAAGSPSAGAPLQTGVPPAAGAPDAGHPSAGAPLQTGVPPAAGARDEVPPSAGAPGAASSPSLQNAGPTSAGAPGALSPPFLRNAGPPSAGPPVAALPPPLQAAAPPPPPQVAGLPSAGVPGQGPPPSGPPGPSGAYPIRNLPPRGFYGLYRPALVAPCAQPGAPSGPFGRPWEGTVPVPPGLNIPAGASAEEILEAFLRIPYRKDGAISEDGRNTLWADPQKTLTSPGLNCSGFMVAAARFLMGVNFTLQEASRDVAADSGKDAPLGEDWDFGLDTALNLAGGGSVIFPWQGEYGRTEDERGRPLGLGADTDGPALDEALARMVPGKLHFFAVSKPDRRFKGGLSYYHNGIALRSPDGVSLFHATGRGGVNRIRLSTPAGMAAFRRYYPPVRGGKRRIVFIEASPPACLDPGPLPGGPLQAPPPNYAAPGAPAAPGLPGAYGAPWPPDTPEAYGPPPPGIPGVSGTPAAPGRTGTY